MGPTWSNKSSKMKVFKAQWGNSQCESCNIHKLPQEAPLSMWVQLTGRHQARGSSGARTRRREIWGATAWMSISLYLTPQTTERFSNYVEKHETSLIFLTNVYCYIEKTNNTSCIVSYTTFGCLLTVFQQVSDLSTAHPWSPARPVF